MAKLSKLEQAAVDMMPEIVAATQAGSFLYKSAFDVAYLIENCLVEQNEEMINDNGEFATRATQVGIASQNFVEQTAPAETTVEEPKPKRKVKMSFEIENIAVTPGKRGGGTRTSQYPIDALEVGQSFFIPASEKHPEPEKSLASMLSGAMKKYDVADLDEAGVQKTKEITVPKTGEKRTIPAMKHTRKFTLVASEKDGVRGARIGRTA